MSIWEKPVSHGELLQRVWKHLDLGVIQRKHPFHAPVFATVDGECAAVRTVILRRFWRSPARLAFHSHTGSPKIGQIRNQPNACWLFYHPEEKLQLRINGQATIHTGDSLADEQWMATAAFGRRCYLGAAPTEISKKPTHGLPDELSDREPTSEESDAGRINFCVVSTSIDYIDCLELDFNGHRRSCFEWAEDGQMTTGWLTP